jgi:hypothetical protein
MASKVSAPNMPILDIVKFPVLYSDGASCLLRARFTRSCAHRTKVRDTSGMVREERTPH